MILIFNEFFVAEDSKGSHMKAIQWQSSDPALETDFLYLVTNSPDLLGDRDLPLRKSLSIEPFCKV